MPAVAEEHPAKFSASVLDAIRLRLRVEAERIRDLGEDKDVPVPRLQVLDPFAGTGRIHQLLDEHDTVGVELEPEWAAWNERTFVGDATKLPSGWTGMFDAEATSAVYPNRMTDTYDGKGRCRTCKGTGRSESRANEPCAKCVGTGIDQSKRYTYTIALGRKPSEGSACTMKWGPEYRSLHKVALIEMIRTVKEDRLVMINMSNHFKTAGSGRNRKRVEVEVVEWWVGVGLELGCRIDAVLPIDTPRMGNGANRDDRADTEKLIVFRTPVERRLL